MAEHPITPPQCQVDAWCKQALAMGADVDAVFLEAARWGADQELEACCHLLRQQGFDVVDDLRATRRPKPPSLKEQAKFAAAVLRSPDETCSIAELQQHWHTICNALEQLND